MTFQALALLASILWLGIAYGANSEPSVGDLLSPYEISVKNIPICLLDTVLAISSTEAEENPIGFAKITKQEKNICVAKVLNHSRNALVRAGDRLRVLDLTKKDEELPGRYDLLQEGNKKTSARYKPLTYAGYLFGQTAATLDKGEFLIGIGPLAYGITDRIQIDTIPFLYLAKIAQFGAKYKFIHSEDARVSVYGTGTRFLSIGKGSWSVEVQYDNATNARSMSHTKLKYSSKLPDSIFLENRDKEKQSSVELTTVSEWILRDWHRMLFGPKFIAGSEKDLGFVFSTIFVFDTWHAAANFQVNSLRKFDLRDYKQVFSVDLFCRF